MLTVAGLAYRCSQPPVLAFEAVPPSSQQSSPSRLALIVAAVETEPVDVQAWRPGGETLIVALAIDPAASIVQRASR